MNIALIGFGLENASAYRYLLAQHPDAKFTVYDEADEPKDELPEGVGFVGRMVDFSGITADLFVRSPGISPYKLGTDKTVTSATKLFFDAWKGTIIGVTGSKGKGTTCSLIASILRAGGKSVELVGNIGAPALDVLETADKDAIIVYELSSFQLWDIEKSPHTAVVLMIEPEHLDVHRDLEDYVNAKSNIARWQHEGDHIIYKVGNQYSERIARLSAGAAVGYPDSETAHIDNRRFFYGETEICPINVLRLPGEHNLDNATAAIDAIWPWVSDPEAIAAGLHDFEGLPHRLKFVGEHAGVRYYDDSIATTPGSAIAAIHSFEEPKVLILGGSSKGADFHELAREISAGNVAHVVLIGAEADRIRAALVDAGYNEYSFLDDVPMAAIVEAASQHAVQGGVVILSPACASFGMFKNYSDRGDQFIAAVSQLQG